MPLFIPTQQTNEALWKIETTFTNTGIKIHGPLMYVKGKRTSHEGLVLLLNCRDQEDFTSVFALKLSPLTGLIEDTVQSAVPQMLTCSVGWSPGFSEEPLVAIDALQAGELSQPGSVLISRMRYLYPLTLIGAQYADLTHVWVRFSDACEEGAWDTIHAFPSRYWRRGLRIFDLETARTDRARQDDGQPKALEKTVLGLPVYGAIALRSNDNSVTITFCQRKALLGEVSLDDSIIFSLTPDSLLNPDGLPSSRLLNEAGLAKLLADPKQTLEFANGDRFEVSLRRAQLTEGWVGLLAVTVSRVFPGNLRKMGGEPCRTGRERRQIRGTPSRKQ